LGRLEVGLALVRSSGTASATPFVYFAASYLYCWIIPILHQYCTTKAHRAVIFAISQLSCLVYFRTFDCEYQGCNGRSTGRTILM